MAVSILDNWSYGGRKPNFERDEFATIADMVAFKESKLPQTFLATVDEDGGVYVFNKNNEVDPVLGKWRKLEGGSSPSGSTSAAQVSYISSEHPEWNTVQKALDGITSIVEYVEPKISLFTMTPSTSIYEVGQSIESLEFAWTYNKAVTSQSLTSATLELSDRSATIDGPFTTGKTFTLTCSDGKTSATATKTISFQNKIYFGSVALPADYDSDFILNLLSKQFTTTKKGTYAFDVADGEYAYIAMPISFGTLSSWYIGGFETTVESCGSIDFTNASGSVVNYSIYRSGRSGLGTISAEIK